MATRKSSHRREAQLGFEAIAIEGGLLSPDWLSRIAQLTAGWQTEADYRVPKGLNLRDEIGRYWRVGQAHWREFAAARNGTADSRLLAARFVQSLLRDSFGFGSLAPVESPVVGDHAYPIGFTALGNRVPVVIAPAGFGLDTPDPAFGEAGRRRTAFGLAQEYLNAEDAALWGIASDGTSLRILRDNASLTRPAWIEADLTRLFEEERYADFAVLWLTAHETRFGRSDQPGSECALEGWREAGKEEGTRAREHLRQGVEDALLALGRGFLSHPSNRALRTAVETGVLSAREYFNQLLRTVYRLIFVLTIEERALLHPDGTHEQARRLYSEGYSMRRLRTRSAKRAAHDRFSDLWDAVQIVFKGLAVGEPRLGLPALAGIFGAGQCTYLDASKLENRALLAAFYRLSWLRQEDGIARVNWRDMGPEELGGVYESLLELVPRIRDGGREFEFVAPEDGQHARRATGSYYTPEKLVRTLLDRALDPIVQSTLRDNPGREADALLELAVVDPTCGSGHFLLAAGRRLAVAVARHRAQGTPSAGEYRNAIRQVVGKCLFGVDLNPLAVELCKVSLWMEAVEPGRPLSFLDAHVQHGNAILGATPDAMAKGIPDGAWDAVEGEDKKKAKALKKRNQQASGGQRGLEALWASPTRPSSDAIARAALALEASSDVDPAAVAQKQAQWDSILASGEYQREKLVADAWCAAFMWPKDDGATMDAAPTNDLWRQIRDGQGQPPAVMLSTTQAIASRYQFLHWHLGFPQVFARGGFDLVLGNPPWIAHAGRAAQPLDPAVKKFYQTNYATFTGYPSTHGIFIALAARLLRQGGAVGIIVPSSVSELPGYEPTRRAHDELCDVPEALMDFGEGQFPGVTQPCMALVSRRTEGGRPDGAQGEPWPMERPDLDDIGRALLSQLAALPPLSRDLFGERGFQSDQAAQQHFLESAVPHDRFTLPLREGTDVREFQLLPPRIHADPGPLGSRLRGSDEYLAVRFVVRNTARYPIAALSDGKAFRNSLLAGFDSEEWPAPALVALLNSSLIRWQHYMRFRDARQPVMPQVKIGHLRSVPRPPSWSNDDIKTISGMGMRLSEANAPPSPDDRTRLDAAVFELYRVDAQSRELVTAWHRRIHESGGRRRRKNEVEAS